MTGNDPVEQFSHENNDLLGGDSALSLIYHIHISPRYNYVYVATPKGACSSIKETLQRLELNDTTFARPGEAAHVRSYSPLLSPVQIGSFARIRNDSRFLMFCFVRNPFTRVLSAYLDKIVRDKPQKASVLQALGRDATVLGQPVSFEQFISALEAQDVEKMDPHWRPQTEHLRIGRLCYGFIGHFENLLPDLERVAGRIGVDVRPFVMANSQHQTGAGRLLNVYYTKDLIKRVQRLYRADFDYFGYSADLGDALLPPRAIGGQR